MVNAFAFWQGTPIDEAPKTFFKDAYEAAKHIQTIAGKAAKDVYIAIGETGWPTGTFILVIRTYTNANTHIDGGSDYGAAKAGTKNAKQYHDKAICPMLALGVDVFYFEAFDEPWKPKSIGDNGKAADETHWGMYTADRQPKFEVSCNIKKH